VVVVAMDLFTETREALLDGTIDVVIATPLAAVARGVVAAMLDSLDGARRSSVLASLRFELCLSENI
jgi:LacI family transcriptional regulator